tara:strand:+ start:805 stop:1014 length:210 start_codon:yes stop_codon:yes gene_type:complete
MKTYRVAICLEEGQVVKVKADSPEQAEEKAYQIAEEFGGTDYPKKHQADCVHRDYFVQDAEEVNDGHTK